MKKFFVFSFLFVSLTGCGSSSQSTDLPPVGTGTDGIVVKARSLITVSTGTQTQSRLRSLLLPQAFAASNGSVSVSTTVAASTSFTLNTSLFSVPANPTPFAANDFGFLQIGALRDNNLNLCGSSGTQHCGTAMIRIYTIGTSGAGLWNTVDQYGAPITSAQSGISPQLSVGLNVAGAAILQQITIPATQHTFQLNQLQNAKYDVTVDFTNAGSGEYSTTLVLEYALAP